MCKNGSHDFLFASANLLATLLVPIHMARSHIVGDSKARTQVELDTRAPHSGQGVEAEACIQGCHLQGGDSGQFTQGPEAPCHPLYNIR